MYGTYLLATMEDPNLDVRVERFDYDIEKEIQLIRDAGRPDIEEFAERLETGVW